MQLFPQSAALLSQFQRPAHSGCHDSCDLLQWRIPGCQEHSQWLGSRRLRWAGSMPAWSPTVPLPELQAGEEQLPAVGKVQACLTSSCAIESKSCKRTPPDLGAGGIPACTSMAPQLELQPRGCLQKHRDLPHAPSAAVGTSWQYASSWLCCWQARCEDMFRQGFVERSWGLGRGVSHGL